ncbi:chloramphenicol-sensitive protein RarD [Microbacteriaceae bacterium SG_E_30_P1]|uniref:Chloramphenicol-sensitive protein RarD n=1 Tax=Antiquaquibacter oligotrophicus TaxID=2880260 RepID=A0ABT6KLE8_9MICO|nr:EamA family transporter RarD [Antiquaquibacter oligotrophicus]MDH6179957.1 chloramphenicol-sensitive protein RarD [Antiquaquibacter oligotrophicus]UDF14284.1 EamA family transporter RarD [Antiquaquibacter oligotrophicus]
MSTAPPVPDRVTGSGLAFALSAYLLWGVLPLAFVLLIPSGPVEIVAWRIVFSLVFCALLLTVTRGWQRFAALARDRRVVLTLAIAAVFILVNWSVFIAATLTGHVVEASLGYFTNPIVTVLLGVLVLRERLRPLQWLAVGISAIAVLVLAIGYGAFPWIALSLAASFGLYGLVKKQVGPKVDAIGGLTMETLVLSPLAVVALVFVQVTVGLTIGTESPLHTAVMLSVGAITAIPLLLFAAAARRLPLVYLGLVQYIAPVLQLIIGVWILGEAMPLERWIGFGIVWLALAILTVDVIRHRSRSDLPAVEPEP